MSICKQVKDKVRVAAALEGMGIMTTCAKIGMSHPRVKRVWDGEDTKIEDVEAVLNSLGFKLVIAEHKKECKS